MFGLRETESRSQKGQDKSIWACNTLRKHNKIEKEKNTASLSNSSLYRSIFPSSQLRKEEAAAVKFNRHFSLRQKYKITFMNDPREQWRQPGPINQLRRLWPDPYGLHLRLAPLSNYFIQSLISASPSQFRIPS
ncbi:hypothetical protein AVEN_15556-1 [Araneus ventricosus]|uniref:Uncharacterized protein n=1 Tax=Araneus ventricosus TaxID=182803 RepID=A0A4Y2FT63_ARAVE|nr:hypothetical protein AVEN_15556-1 [Araneus ventricosus]